MQSPKPLRSFLSFAFVVTAILAVAAVLAGELAVTAVNFAPAAVTEMERYGEDEQATLRSAILTALSRATGGSTTPSGLSLTVTVRDVAPTHPTRKQLADDPAADRLQSKFLGGAELTGEVRDAEHRVVATVNLRYFAPGLPLGPASSDPWADARVAIDRFARRVAAECRELPADTKSGPG